MAGAFASIGRPVAMGPEAAPNPGPLRGHDVREGGRWTPSQRLKNDVIYAFVRAVLFVSLAVPRALLLALGRALGVLAYGAAGSARRAARDRLAAGLGRAVRSAEVRRAFSEAGALLADMVSLMDPAEAAGRGLSLDPASADLLASVIAEGRGVVFVSAHVGPWERMAAELVVQGFAISTVARESYDPRLTQVYERIRAPRGVRSIYRGSPHAALAIARELAAGRIVGFLVDLPGRVPSMPARFFGSPGAIAIGPARIALARGAAVVVGTPMPRADGEATIRIVRVPTGDLGRGKAGEDGAKRLCDRLAREIDRRIRAWPRAWLGLFAPTSKFDTGFGAPVDWPEVDTLSAASSPRSAEPRP